MEQGLRRNRILAIASLSLTALMVIVLISALAENFSSLVFGFAGLLATAGGAWIAITEHMPRRAIGAAFAVGGVIMMGASLPRFDGGGVFVVVVLLGIAAVVCARLAVAETLHAIDFAAALPARRPRHPVLIVNPKSGGGKVEQFGIADRARTMGVEVVELKPGDDLQALAHDAVRRGADCLGMAGGDGSQALVAAVAVSHGVPFVCISAGTRNHFAADLGLNRADPASGLIAFREGVVRDFDYGLVGDRLFVNNVSLGFYASVVEQARYRDAKLTTILETLPTVVGPGGKPFDLQFSSPDGRSISGALLVMVSNNPYVLAPGPDMAQRRSLTGGQLGVVAMMAEAGEEAPRLIARLASGLIGGDPNMLTFTSPTFEVASGEAQVPAGIDGESVTLTAPLQFRIVPKGLQMLVPADTLTVTASKRYREFGVRGLWDIARGREPRVEDVLH